MFMFGSLYMWPADPWCTYLTAYGWLSGDSKTNTSRHAASDKKRLYNLFIYYILYYYIIYFIYIYIYFN